MIHLKPMCRLKGLSCASEIFERYLFIYLFQKPQALNLSQALKESPPTIV